MTLFGRPPPCSSPDHVEDWKRKSEKEKGKAFLSPSWPPPIPACINHTTVGTLFLLLGVTRIAGRCAWGLRKGGGGKISTLFFSSFSFFLFAKVCVLLLFFLSRTEPNQTKSNHTKRNPQGTWKNGEGEVEERKRKQGGFFLEVRGAAIHKNRCSVPEIPGK